MYVGYGAVNQMIRNGRDQEQIVGYLLNEI